jgi:hypothetical protein
VAHPVSYNGTGGVISNKVCIVAGSTLAASLEIPVQNSIDRFNQLVAIEDNLLFGSDNDITSGSIDIESALMHEVGHCIGLAHPNIASGAGLSGSDTNYTKTTMGPNASFDIGIGADNVRGSADDVRGDDVNLHWFLKSSNNPFDAPNETMDQSDYSRDLVDLPAGSTFPANADRTVSSLYDLPTTEAIMQQGQASNEDQRALAGDDVNTLLFARSGIDHVSGTSDDYSLNLVYGGISDDEDCNINISLDTSTVFAVCRLGGRFLDGNNIAISSANIHYNEDSNWFFTSKRVPSPATDFLTVDAGESVSQLDGGAISLLFNDTHPDTLALTMSTQVFRGPSYGSVTLNPNGTFSYTHGGGSSSSDVFVYQTCVDDAGATNTCSYGTVKVSINLSDLIFMNGFEN